MSTCSCITASGKRCSRQVEAPVKLCWQHRTCTPAKVKPAAKAKPAAKGIPSKKEKAGYTVVFTMKYARTNDESGEADPSAKILERYIAASTSIPEFLDFTDIKLLSPVRYIGKMQFQFECTADLSKVDLAGELLHASLADGAWEAPPGDGSFVYPTKKKINGIPEELGVLSFADVTINGKKFT
jgi:hypothetical protein